MNDDRIVKRLYARGVFCLLSSAHFGGGDEGPVDMSLLRDADGNPYIPGSSIAGAARSHLALRYHPWDAYCEGDKSWDKLKLFSYLQSVGTANRQRTMSPLVVSDARLVSDGAVVTAVRDGVRITGETGTAAEGAKFDFEVVEAGTRFALNLMCIIRKNDPIAKIVEQFHAMLHAFEKGEIRLGARTSRGLGCGKVANWEIAELDMSNPAHVRAWLCRDPWSVPDAKVENPLQDGSLDFRSYFRIGATFRLRTSLLIREADPPDEDCDFAHLRSAGKPVMPGTSATGAWRSQVELIARTLWGESKDGLVAHVLAELFGPLHENGSKAPPDDNQLWRSRIRIEEEFVKGGSLDLKERVAIDRFTGSGLDTAKFNEKPLEPGPDGAKLALELTLENPQDCEIGLLLLALKDFWLGRASLGGESSLGRGLLIGETALLQHFMGKPSDGLAEATPSPQVWQLKERQGRSGFDCIKDNRQDLAKFIQAAQNAPEPGYNRASRRPVDSSRRRKETRTNDAAETGEKPPLKD